MTACSPARPDPKIYEPLIGRLSKALNSKGYLFATAESCTGGLIAGMCTDMPGSSAWFSGGVVAYADEVKLRLLDVPKDLLRNYGAVSEPVVRRMALGALAACNAQAALAVSGIAGPDGGTLEKPVGTVWIAYALVEAPPTTGVCAPDTLALEGLAAQPEDYDAPFRETDNCEVLSVTLAAECHHFKGSRVDVRLAAVEAALRGMLKLLE